MTDYREKALAVAHKARSLNEAGAWDVIETALKEVAEEAVAKLREPVGDEEVREALNPYCSHPTLTPESEKEITRKWMVLAIALHAKTAALSAHEESKKEES